MKCCFLPSGKYRLEYWADGKYASKKPMDVNRDAVIWTAGKPLTIKMAAGGGYVGVFVPFDKKWGIAGIKIDFMDRDDQEMVIGIIAS